MAAALQIQTDSSVQEQWQQQLSQLCENPIEPDCRMHWMVIMRDKLFGCVEEPQAYVVSEQDHESINLMIQLAEYLSDWALVVCLRQILIKSQLPTHLARENQSALTFAYYQQGLLLEAADTLKINMLVDHQQSALLNDYCRLHQELTNLPASLADLSDKMIRLLPLSKHHLDAFSWVYADPKISELCNLPQFVANEQWLDWLESNQKDGNKHVFAILHQQWGFIGSVSLEVINGVGFFYYWLGADFQGHGLGPEAVDILLNVGAQYLAMQCCFAKVYKHNTSSQKAMIKLGFEALSFSAQSPNQDEIFYYLGPPKPALEKFELLQLLFLAQQCDIRLCGMLAWQLGLNN